MAKFWKHLKRHEDTIEKHMITEEEILFLKNLQHEMNTQDCVGQANPRYWVIRDYAKVYGKDLSSADGISIYDSNRCHSIIEVEYQFFRVDEVIKAILQAFSDGEYDLAEEEIENIKLAYDMNSLVEYLEEIESYEFTISEYQDIAVDKGMFLTHEAAVEHLRQNSHHYAENAHTYAHTAWRSQEEPLWEIMQKVDFDRLLECIGG